MDTNYAKTMLVLMNMTDEAAILIISNDGRGLILIDGVSQFNKKYVDSIYRLLIRPGGTTGGGGG